MRSTRLRSSRSALLPIVLLVAALIFWPAVDGLKHQSSSAQGVSWLGAESTNYLTSSSGIPVWVPSWLPAPVAGTTPEIYAGGGSYSIYFYAGNSFLYITGVAGAGFPAGSEADLNVELSVNASVAGYPAIHDLGVPQGSETPIYDKVMWIADGVLYTINGNGLDSDSMSLANSSVVLQPQAAPAPTQPPAVPTEPPAQQPPADTVDQNTGASQPVSNPSSVQGTNSSETGQADVSSSSTGSTVGSEEEPVDSAVTDDPDESVDTQNGNGSSDDGTGGAWYTGNNVDEAPSDGTAGPPAPHLGPSDGTGGAP